MSLPKMAAMEEDDEELCSASDTESATSLPPILLLNIGITTKQQNIQLANM